MAYDGIVLSRVNECLDESLIRGRINKIYQVSKYELLLNIRSNAKNVKLLISIHPMYARVQLTKLNYPTPDFPNAYTMLMRKHLEGAFIFSIQQIELDRILEIIFIGKNELGDDVKYYGYVEIMGKHSNFILCYENRKIIDCLKRVSPSINSKRILQPGGTYAFPPMVDKKDPFHSDFIESNSLTKIYQGFSPDLSNEVIYRMNHGESFQSIMNEIKNSHSLFIHKTDKKDYYHVIELKHLSSKYKQYDLFDGLDEYYDFIDQRDRIKQQTSDLLKYIQQEYNKNVNKLQKLELTLFDSENSDDYRVNGDLLYSNLHLLQKGMKSVEVFDYYENKNKVIDLDEKLDGKANAQKYYNKYQKAKNSIQVLNEQITLTKEEISYFDSLLSQMSLASYYDALEIKEELENLGYVKKKKKKELNKKKGKPHFTTYITKDNIKIYVGKNNLQNDYLTFKQAVKSDMWFHVKDMPGSHIVVHSEDLDEYTIRLASKMAAYFSTGKNSSSVPVNYTLVKTLKKPHSNKPGQVILDNYKTIYIDPDDEFLEEVTKTD